jgi:hypothetical protein
MRDGSRRGIQWVSPLLLVLAPAMSLAMYGFQPDLPPKTYRSPSGELTLFVDPSQRSGAGEARYELERKGALVWAGARPFTLWDAAVADDGTVAGYGYSHGYNRPFEQAGDFLVVILDPSGAPRLVEKTPREASGRLHTMADPKARGLFLDAPNDRLVVRVVDPDASGGETWWTYRLGTGAPLERSAPGERMPDAPPSYWIVAARPVAGTPLTLVHWLRQDVGSGPGSPPGARFTLVDPAYAPVWTLELPGDYEVRGDEGATARLERSIFEHGAILDTGPPHRFAIRHAAAGMRVAYEVEPGEEAAGGWSVREVARTPYAEPGAPEQRAAGVLAFPEVALRKIGSISLTAGPAPPDGTPIRDVSELAIDDRGRFGFLRCDGCGSASRAAFVVVDADGVLVQSVALPQLPQGGASARHLAWLGGDRWLVAASEQGAKVGTSAIRVDLGTGAATPFEGFDCPPIEALAPTRDGGFVALTRSYAEGTVVDALYAFDAQGRRRWRVAASFEDETLLFDPVDVAVATTGEVVVLEGIANQLKVYTPEGAYRYTVDLEEAWDRAPNYLSAIAPDADGGVVIFDFEGKPPVVRMKRDGSVLGQLTPAFPGGRAFDVHGRVQTGADGRLWTSDGHAVLRLDDRGVVDRALGERPDPEVLGEVAAIRVDGKGTIYAADRRTAAVHLFDPEGRRLRVFRPDPGDYDGQLVSASLAVSDAGDVFLSRGAREGDHAPEFLHYSPAGGRVGVESLGVDPISEDWYWQSTTGSRWVVGFENLFLVGPDGRASRTIERTAEGQWLERPAPAAVAPDGRIAVVSEARPLLPEDSDDERVVTIFSREGDALATWPAPEGLLPWAGAAFDGSRFAALVRAPSAGSSKGIGVVALDARGKPLFRFEPPGLGEGARPFLVPRGGGGELWLFDGRTSIDRYALP